MSTILKTVTPFLEKSFLLKALEKCNITYQDTHNQIRINQSYNLNFTIGVNGNFTLQHSSHFNAQSFIQPIETEYRNYYNSYMKELEEKRLEEEKIRIENERKAFVKKQRAEIIKRAEAKGYKVKEKMKGKQIQLVLVKHTY